MDKELKAKWVAALRSGKYQQARGTLNNCGGGYCCLGVLLGVWGRGEWNSESYETEAEDGGIESFDGDLGRIGRRIFGISDEHESALIAMNDGEEEADPNRKSFAEIADYIEENL
jgi:hypothetical protein